MYGIAVSGPPTLRTARGTVEQPARVHRQPSVLNASAPLAETREVPPIPSCPTATDRRLDGSQPASRRVERLRNRVLSDKKTFPESNANPSSASTTLRSTVRSRVDALCAGARARRTRSAGRPA